MGNGLFSYSELGKHERNIPLDEVRSNKLNYFHHLMFGGGGALLVAIAA